MPSRRSPPPTEALSEALSEAKSDTAEAAATERLILDSAERLFRDRVTPALRARAQAGELPGALLQALDEAGFLALATAALPASTVYRFLRLAGRYAVPLPLAELLLARRWLEGHPSLEAGSGADPTGPGLLSIGRAAPVTAGDDPGIGSVQTVPWGEQAALVICLPAAADLAAALAAQSVALVQPQSASATATVLAPEPLANVRGSVSHRLPVANAFAQLALARAASMTGGLEQVLALALQTVTDREQFGQALGRFQAIQHQLAVLAAEVAAASMATESAIAAAGTPAWVTAVAAAKARVGEAAGQVAEIAHQVHGAMGFTQEHELHQYTLRLWRWRDDYGHEAEWQDWLGARLLEGGADAAWDFVLAGN